MKKNMWQLLGIIALVAVIGPGLAGCKNEPSDPPGGGNKATLIIKNQSDSPIEVAVEDEWDPESPLIGFMPDGAAISSGLGTKTINAHAEGTWSLERSSGDGSYVYVGIDINGDGGWSKLPLAVEYTREMIWDGSKLSY